MAKKAKSKPKRTKKKEKVGKKMRDVYSVNHREKRVRDKHADRIRKRGGKILKLTPQEKKKTPHKLKYYFPD